MSATERQRRWRAKLRGSKPKTVTLTEAEAADIVALVTQMQKRIAELEGRSAAAKKAVTAAPNFRRAKDNSLKRGVTLYDLLSTYADAIKRRAMHGRPPRRAARKRRGHR
jgi:hypothetical protein